jgi:perosamine synthetase
MNHPRISSKEYEYVKQVLDTEFRSSKSSMMTKKLEEFFQKQFNVKHAIAHCNGTATMHCGLLAVGVKPGDEVIVPPLTMASTSFAVLHANAVPVFADVDAKTFVISAESIRQKITNKTKAIIVVALYGLSPDMDEIMSIAKEHNLIVIEDNAECYLGYYKGRIVGSLGHMASFSFQSSKHITSGEGGMLITENDEFAEKIRKFNSLGYAGVSASKAKISKEEIQDPDYERHIQVGFNFRISELCAAVALAQLERLEELVNVRIKVAEAYGEAVKGCSWLRPQFVPDDYINPYWTYAVVLEHPEITWHQFREVFQKFGGDGFYAAWKLTYHEPVFRNKNYYLPESVVLSDIYSKYEYLPGLCQNAEYLQPRLIQFKTNYFNNPLKLTQQIDALKKTINYLCSNSD